MRAHTQTDTSVKIPMTVQHGRGGVTVEGMQARVPGRTQHVGGTPCGEHRPRVITWRRTGRGNRQWRGTEHVPGGNRVPSVPGSNPGGTGKSWTTPDSLYSTVQELYPCWGLQAPQRPGELGIHVSALRGEVSSRKVRKSVKSPSLEGA